MKRRIPMDKDFMAYGVEDILYGMISLKATYNKHAEELYITYNNLLEVKREYRSTGLVRSRQTVDNRIKKFIEKGYLIEKNNGDQIIYILAADSSKWELVDYDMLRYLVATRNTNCIKIYCYLLNKYKWKKQTYEYYSLTIKEIALALGYSESSANKNSMITGMISAIIESLNREGIITIANYYDGKSPRIRLLNVVEKKNELK